MQSVPLPYTAHKNSFQVEHRPQWNRKWNKKIYKILRRKHRSKPEPWGQARVHMTSKGQATERKKEIKSVLQRTHE